MSWKCISGESTTGTAVSSTGLHVRGHDKHTVAAEYAGGTSATALVVKLQGSVDNQSNWFDLASQTATSDHIADGSLMFHVVNKPVDWVRVQYTTDITTTGTATVNAWYLSGREGRV